MENAYQSRSKGVVRAAPKGKRAVQRHVAFNLPEWDELIAYVDKLAAEKQVPITPRMAIMYLVRKETK